MKPQKTRSKNSPVTTAAGKSKRPVKTGGAPRKAPPAPKPRNQASSFAHWASLIGELEIKLTQLEAENESLRDDVVRLEEARKAQERYHDQVPFGSVTLDAKGNILDINRAALTFLDRTKPQLLRSSFSLVVAPKELPEFLDYLGRCRRARNLVSIRLHLRGGGNEFLPVHLSTVSILDPKSGVASLRMSFLDLTLQQRVEELRKSHEELEQGIRARTLEISRTNAELQREIEEHRRTVLSLRQSETRFRSLLAAVPDMIFRIRSDGTYLDFHAENADELVMPPDRIIGSNIRQSPLPPELIARSLQTMEIVLKTGRIQTLEYTLPSPGGFKHYEARMGKCAEDEVVSIVRDMTEIRQRNESLRRSEANLARAQALAHMGSFEYELTDPPVVSWSREVYNILGLDPATKELPASQFIQQVVHPEDRARLQRRFQRIQGSEASLTGEFRIVRPDGSVRHLHSVIEIVRNHARGTATLMGMFLDITEHKTIELEKARMAAIVEFSSDAITATDLQGRLISWNRGAERLYGYTAEETIGRSITFLVAPERRAELEITRDRMLLGEKLEPFETVRLHKNGQRVQITLTLSPVRDTEGKIVGISGIARDIGERKRLEAEILRVSEREQRRIAQDLHDGLGQELAGIACLAQVLQTNLREEGSPHVANALKISRLLNGAVAQTRSLARGLYPVEAEPHGLMSALHALTARTEDLFRVKCRFLCPEPVLVEDNVVATHLYRIAQEAVSNAIKHGRARQIDVGLRATTRNIILAVRDDGVGLRPRRRPVQGMGLRIMNYRAGIIGGTLVVQKKAGGGTEVVMTVVPPWKGPKI